MSKSTLTIIVAALFIFAASCGNAAPKSNASTMEMPEQVSDTLKLTQTCLVTFHEMPMEETFSYDLHDTEEIFRNMDIDIIYTESRYLSYMLNNEEKRTIDLKKHLKETQESVLLYKKGKAPIYVGFGDDINMHKVFNLLGDEAIRKPVSVPNELVIIPGQQVGDKIIDRKGDYSILCIKTDKYRTAENLGVGSTAKEVTEVYKNHKITIWGENISIGGLYLYDDYGRTGIIYCYHPNGMSMGIEFRVKKERTPDGRIGGWRVTEVRVYDTGYAKNETTWKENSRVKTLRLYVGNRHWCDLRLKDTDKPQIFQLPEGLEVFPRKHGAEIPAKGEYAQWVDREPEVKIHTYQTNFRFEIMEVYPGDKYDNTCITGIAIDVSRRPISWE